MASMKKGKAPRKICRTVLNQSTKVRLSETNLYVLLTMFVVYNNLKWGSAIFLQAIDIDSKEDKFIFGADDAILPDSPNKSSGNGWASWK